MYNLSEATQMIERIINTNREFLKRGIKNRLSVELIGDSGVGKTSAVIQVAEKLNIPFVKLNLSMIEEVGD